MISHDNKRVNAIQAFQDIYDQLPDIHVLCGEARFKELLEGVTFGGASTIHQLKVVKGLACRSLILSF